MTIYVGTKAKQKVHNNKCPENLLFPKYRMSNVQSADHIFFYNFGKVYAIHGRS